MIQRESRFAACLCLVLCLALCLVFVAQTTGQTSLAHVKGKWIRLFDGPNCTGQSRMFYCDVRKLDDYGWGDRARSLEVGPNASVAVFEDNNFRDNRADFGSGSRVFRLGNLDKNIDSFMVR